MMSEQGAHEGRAPVSLNDIPKMALPLAVKAWSMHLSLSGSSFCVHQGPHALPFHEMYDDPQII